MKSKVLVEELALRPTRVDAEKGILYDCLLLGEVSKNGTTYPADVRSKALPLFENAKVNLSHPEGKGDQKWTASTPWDRRFGKTYNTRNTPEGIRGDVQVLTKHPFTPSLMEAAEKMPELFGFSPLMRGKTLMEDNKEVCKEIEKVRSVDLVTDPGTARTLYEEEEPKPVEAKAEEAPQEEYEHMDPKAAFELSLLHSVLAEVEKFLDEGKGHEEHLKRIGEHLKHHAKMHHTTEEKKEEEPKKEEGKEEPKAEHKEEVKEEEDKWDIFAAPKQIRTLAEEVTTPSTSKKVKSGFVGAVNGSTDKDWSAFLRS